MNEKPKESCLPDTTTAKVCLASGTTFIVEGAKCIHVWRDGGFEVRGNNRKPLAVVLACGAGVHLNYEVPQKPDC